MISKNGVQNLFLTVSLFGCFGSVITYYAFLLCTKKGKSITNFNAELREYDYRHFLRLADFR